MFVGADWIPACAGMTAFPIRRNISQPLLLDAGMALTWR
jgi:hypothetical protein